MSSPPGGVYRNTRAEHLGNTKFLRDRWNEVPGEKLQELIVKKKRKLP